MKTKSLLFALIFFTAVSCKKQDPDPVPASGEIKLGAILDLTGDYSEEGLAGKAAIELAIVNLNERYILAGSTLRFSCSYADTHMDTNLTRSAAKTMYADGIRLLVAGPGNSTELKFCLLFANRTITSGSHGNSMPPATLPQPTTFSGRSARFPAVLAGTVLPPGWPMGIISG